MRLAWTLLTLFIATMAAPATAQDRRVVDSSAPMDIAITIYRDPDRSPNQPLRADWPRGFAMISETRTVSLPPGRSTIRFEGVAEGMVAVSAIVTGLPGGAIEKNRNADLLSPAALVNRALGNRVRITRTNPGTGEEASEDAIVRTRADGGLVLQTGDGYEAVRCSGLPERLSFDSVPGDLSANPVFTIDTASPAGGTFTVNLTYLAWGFDWEANYVATITEFTGAGDVRFDLSSWLTVLNDNGQSFADAQLLAVAGTLNVVSNYQALSDPPVAAPLRLTCYPIGSTSAGSPGDNMIVVTGRRAEASLAAPMAMRAVADEMLEASDAVLAGEEALGDLKLYRVPLPVDVNAQGLKQVAFLDESGVEGRLLFSAACNPYNHHVGDDATGSLQPTSLVLVTNNDEAHGLGMSLPMGAVIAFEPTSAGLLPFSELSTRDHAVGQDVEWQLVEQSSTVFSDCARVGRDNPNANGSRWTVMRATILNSRSETITLRLALGDESEWQVRVPGQQPYVRHGQRYVDVQIPANSTRDFDWRIRLAAAG